MLSSCQTFAKLHEKGCRHGRCPPHPLAPIMVRKAAILHLDRTPCPAQELRSAITAHLPMRRHLLWTQQTPQATALLRTQRRIHIIPIHLVHQQARKVRLAADLTTTTVRRQPVILPACLPINQPTSWVGHMQQTRRRMLIRHPLFQILQTLGVHQPAGGMVQI